MNSRRNKNLKEAVSRVGTLGYVLNISGVILVLVPTENYECDIIHHDTVQNLSLDLKGHDPAILKLTRTVCVEQDRVG